MKKYTFLLAAALSSLLFLFLSCDKEDNTPKTKTELLAQASWKYKSATVNGVAYTDLPACQIDNTIKINIAGNGTVDEGSMRCDPSDPQTYSFTWTFQNAETEIVLSIPLFANGSDTVTIVSVTETELILLIPIYTLGPPVQARVVFQH